MFAVTCLLCAMWLGFLTQAPDTPDADRSADVSPAHWIHDRNIYMPIHTKAYESRVEGYVGFDDHDHGITIAPDTMADLTMIKRSVVRPEWRRLDALPRSVSGIGKAELSERVLVPVRQQWGAQMDYLPAYIGDTPPGIDLLMGVDSIDTLGAMPDHHNHRVIMKKHGMVIPTD